MFHRWRKLPKSSELFRNLMKDLRKVRRALMKKFISQFDVLTQLGDQEHTTWLKKIVSDAMKALLASPVRALSVFCTS